MKVNLVTALPDHTRSSFCFSLISQETKAYTFYPWVQPHAALLETGAAARIRTTEISPAAVPISCFTSVNEGSKRHMKKPDRLSDLKSIFCAGVKQVDPAALIKNRVAVRDNLLCIRSEESDLEFDIGRYDKIIVTGAGKATAKMAEAVERIFEGRTIGGAIAVKYGHTRPLESIRTIEAGHPVPDENSVLAARKIKEIARDADENTIVISLISGGGSSLLASPVELPSESGDIRLTLDDLQKTTGLLLASGATIDEMNCVRKHLSSIKGGRLSALMYPATQVNLILSDVVGDRLDVIASGLTAGDETTYADALQVLARYEIEKEVPERVLKVLSAGKAGLVAETPKAGDPVFGKVHNVIIGSNYTALMAAAERAKGLGYNTVVLSSRIIGEAKEAAKFYAGIAKDACRRQTLARKPACIMGGGETTVTLTGKGKGGRSQELALSFLVQFLDDDDDTKRGVFFLAASTDGNDGPTDAAGAYVLAQRANRRTDPYTEAERYLKNNDSYTFFERAGLLFKTGPTNTNVCDLQILIVT